MLAGLMTAERSRASAGRLTETSCAAPGATGKHVASATQNRYVANTERTSKRPRHQFDRGGPPRRLARGAPYNGFTCTLRNLIAPPGSPFGGRLPYWSAIGPCANWVCFSLEVSTPFSTTTISGPFAVIS